MDKRKIATETLVFTDGSERDVNIHSVGNYDMMKLRRQFRKTKLDKKGNVEDVIFEDENFILAILNLSIGTSITKEELMCVENDLKEIYDKHFGDLSKSKKSKLTDTSEQNQGNESLV